MSGFFWFHLRERVYIDIQKGLQGTKNRGRGLWGGMGKQKPLYQYNGPKKREKIYIYNKKKSKERGREKKIWDFRIEGMKTDFYCMEL